MVIVLTSCVRDLENKKEEYSSLGACLEFWLSMNRLEIKASL